MGWTIHLGIKTDTIRLDRPPLRHHMCVSIPMPSLFLENFSASTLNDYEDAAAESLNNLRILIQCPINSIPFWYCFSKRADIEYR